MDLMDFFDINNIDHLTAYKHLTEHGTWPEDFIPEDCTLSAVWPYQIAEKMALAYVNLGITGGIPDVHSNLTEEEVNKILKRGYF